MTPDERDSSALSAVDDRELGNWLDALEGDQAATSGAAPEREFLELAGLLTLDSEPLRPPPTLKAGLFERIGAEARAAHAPTSGGRRAEGGPRTLSTPRADARVTSGSGRFGSGRSSLPLRLAATVAVVSTAAALWFGIELAANQRETEQLRASLAEIEQRLRSEQAERVELASVRGALELVTSPRVEVARLVPMVESAGLPVPGESLRQVQGMLFVAENHQHWYLAIEGLDPAPTGHAYHLWFVAHGKPLAAGSFRARPGERVELHSDTMPEGTTAVAVSLEPDSAGEHPEAPAASPLLIGQGLTRLG